MLSPAIYHGTACSKTRGPCWLSTALTKQHAESTALFSSSLFNIFPQGQQEPFHLNARHITAKQLRGGNSYCSLDRSTTTVKIVRKRNRLTKPSCSSRFERKSSLFPAPTENTSIERKQGLANMTLVLSSSNHHTRAHTQKNRWKIETSQRKSQHKYIPATKRCTGETCAHTHTHERSRTKSYHTNTTVPRTSFCCLFFLLSQLPS